MRDNNFKFFIFILIGAFCLMADAFYNGFPIVCSDSSTYMASGFEFEAPFDRPITYGLFLRVFSIDGFSLWLVILSQALILSYLIFLLTKLIVGKETFLKFGFITILIMSSFTSASWTVSQIMPDIFTPIALLCIPLILKGTYRPSTLILLYGIFFMSVAMHMSHILLFGLLLILIYVFRKMILPKEDYVNRNVQIFTLLFLTAISIITMGSAISKSKHVFFMGAMVEHGITKKYLDDYCPIKQYKLCAYKDSLPDKAYKFIWDEQSVFYKIGGWKETKNEFEEIIYKTLSQPKYIMLHIKESFKATLQQLILFEIGDGNQSFPDGTILYQRVLKYFPNDINSYSTSKQNQSLLNCIKFLNPLFLVFLIFCLLLMILLLIKYSSILMQPFKFIVLITSAFLILNAWDCGTFANALGRLQCKIIWLVPLLATLLIFKLCRSKE